MRGTGGMGWGTQEVWGGGHRMGDTTGGMG